MYGEIVAAATSLRAAGQIAKGLIDLETTTEVQAKAIELNGLILDAQGELLAANAAQASLIEQVRDLEGQIARMKDWEAQKQRYKLVMPFAGCMVYALQKAMSEGEPPHYICTNCYENAKRSILQGKEGPPGIGLTFATYYCPVCKTEARTKRMDVTLPQYFEDIKQQG